jgi:hypothetical protein
MKKELTFKVPMLVVAIVCAIVGLVDFFSKPLTIDEVFNLRPVLEVKGWMVVYTPPRGTPRVQITSVAGKIYFVDCLVVRGFCDGRQAQRDVDAELVRIKGRFYWPRVAVYRPGGELQQDESKVLYELYAEREVSFYRFWLALAFSFVLFSFWFGDRPLFKKS